MAEVTKTVCDACGLSSSIRAGEPVKLALFIGKDTEINLDVHNSARCIKRAVAAVLDKRFNVNGAA